jgi:hypothetical protein
MQVTCARIGTRVYLRRFDNIPATHRLKHIVVSTDLFHSHRTTVYADAPATKKTCGYLGLQFAPLPMFAQEYALQSLSPG